METAKGSFYWHCPQCIDKGTETKMENNLDMTTLSEQIKDLTKRIEAVETRDNVSDISSSASS